MMNHEDRELENLLRSLPTASPPAEVRERILRTAARSPRKRTAWKLGLAYALCLLGLIALDIGVDSIQSARLSQLIGDGRHAGTPKSVAFSLTAMRQREATMLAMIEGEQRMR